MAKWIKLSNRGCDNLLLLVVVLLVVSSHGVLSLQDKKCDSDYCLGCESSVPCVDATRLAKDVRKLPDEGELSGPSLDQPHRIAFLFISGGPVPFETLWRRFFALQNKNRYSLYVYVGSSDYTFPSDSLFFNSEVRSHSAPGNVGLAFRWTLAVALLDQNRRNTWFVNVCGASLPLRSFNQTYDYLTSSRHSFVQSFSPIRGFRFWDTQPQFDQSEIRKGEIWMALRRKHATIIVKDRETFIKFASNAREPEHVFEDEYLQTLLNLRDPSGITNRTVMFADYSNTGVLPRVFHTGDSYNMQQFLHEMVTMTVDTTYGLQHLIAVDNRPVPCELNGNPGVVCFLFGRVFHENSLPMLIGLQIPNI